MAGPTIPTFAGAVQLVTSAGTAFWTAVTTPTATLTGLLNTLGMAVYHTAPTARTDGQVGPAEADAQGNLKVAINDGVNQVAVETAGADAGSNTQNALTVKSRLIGFNGTTWDRLRTAITTPSATLTGMLTMIPWAIYNATPTTRTEAQGGPLQASARGAIHSRNDELFPGEDVNANVMRVEEQFTGIYCTGDTQVKASAGFIHTVTFYSTDAAPTAGTIIIYDNTAASGTIIASFDIPVTTKWNPFTLIFDRICATGIYVDFTTVADVTCQVTYR